MTQELPEVHYHTMEDLTSELQRNLDAAFDILFGETVQRLSKEPGCPRVDVSVDSQQAAGQGTFNV